MTATIRLMQEGGVSGPFVTLDVPDDEAGQNESAQEWAAGMTGHPWDHLTIEAGDGECREVPQS